MMASVYIILCWIVLGLFVTDKKGLSNKETAFIWLLILTINTHFWLVIAEPIKLINITTNPKKYIAFVIFRSVFTPVLIAYILNRVFSYESSYWKFIFVGLGVLILVVLQSINTYHRVTEHVNWSIIYTFVYFLLLFLIAYYFTHLFKRRWVNG